MFASATAHAIGCPPKVKPWAKVAFPCRNGSATRSHAIIAPIGAYAEVRPFAVVIDVRLVAVALAAEPVAEAPPRADHLVGDQQHVVAVADLAHALEVALLGDEAAAAVLHRLEDHRGHGVGTLEQDRLLDRVGRPQRVAVLRPAVGVGVRRVPARRA